jgi:Ca-activated chloride channel family protein
MNENDSTDSNEKEKVTRIEYAKQALYALLDITESERVGLVVFAQNAYTILPLSFDHIPLRYYASQLQVYPGTIEDGTAIWDSLMVSIDRFLYVDSPAKAIVLITDGANNCGFFESQEVLERLSEEKIRLYVVHIGDYHGFSVTVQEEIDRVKRVSEKSSGVFFTFSEEKNIRKIAKQIESLERSIEEKRERIQFHQDYFQYFLLAALVSLAISLNIDWIYRKGFLL